MLTAANHMYNCALNFAEPANRNSIQVDCQCLKYYAQKGIFLMSRKPENTESRDSHTILVIYQKYLEGTRTLTHIWIWKFHTYGNKVSNDVQFKSHYQNYNTQNWITYHGCELETLSSIHEKNKLFSVLLLFATKFSFDVNKLQKLNETHFHSKLRVTFM